MNTDITKPTCKQPREELNKKGTQSDKLRQRQTRDGGGASINNTDAKVHDVNVKDVARKVMDECIKKYPGRKWTHKNSLHQSDISKHIVSTYKPEKSGSCIRPDGGILYADDIPVLVTEAKKQGTNNVRAKEGKKKQAMGNAIERAHKNYNELRNLFDPYPFFPYLVFAYGCDFEKGSSIIDRLGAMTYYDDYNTLYIRDTIVEKNIYGGMNVNERHKKASVFIQVEGFSKEFIFEKSMEAVDIVMNLL